MQTNNAIVGIRILFGKFLELVGTMTSRSTITIAVHELSAAADMGFGYHLTVFGQWFGQVNDTESTKGSLEFRGENKTKNWG